MDAVMAVKRGEQGARLPERRSRQVRRQVRSDREPGGAEISQARSLRSDVAELADLPEPPFWGTRVATGIPLAEYAGYLDERATFMGQWGLKPSRAVGGTTYAELVEQHGRPRLRMWLERARAEGLLEAAVVYGYFRCFSEGNDLIVLDGDGQERERFTFPRQRRDRRLCLADFFAPRGSGRTDVVAFQLVTMGPRVSEATAELFAKNSYRDYLELHGLSVQLTEALAEYWHARVRRELDIGAQDPADIEGFFRLGYRGPGTPSATRPAPTWLTGPRSPGCCGPPTSASSSPKRCSLFPSSPPTRSSFTTPRRNTFPRDGRPPHRPARRIRHTRRSRAGWCRAAGCAVRHGRPADRLRAALVRGRDRSDGPARRDLDRSRPGGAARQLAGQRGPLLPGAGRQAGRSGPGAGLDDPRDRRPGARAGRDRDAGRGRAGGRGGGLGPALRAGDLLAARVRGRGTGPHRPAVSCAGVRERRPPRQTRPRAVPARGAPAGRGPGPVPGAGGLAHRYHRGGGGGLFRGRGTHSASRRAPAGPPGRALAA